MLTGEYQHNIDVKGRIFIPSKFRDDLKERFMLARGLDGCIFVYAMEEWKELAEKIKALPMSSTRQVQRFLFSGATEVELDKQGRVVISPKLREHAGLTEAKSATIIGVSNRAEIWNTERWENACDSISDEEIALEMEKLGF